MSRVERSQAREEKQQRQAEMTSQQKAAKRKKKKGKGLLVLILILAAAVAAGGWYVMGLGPAEPGNEEPVMVEVTEGTGASGLVYTLEEAGLVKNMLCARINARIGGHHPKANTYVLNRSMSLAQIMDVIDNGTFEYISKESFEVKDGARLLQVADAMAEQFPFTAEEIMAKWSDKAYLNKLIDKYWFLTDEILDKDVMYPLEGYLYADTYIVTTDNASIEEFTEMCLDRMDEELTPRKEAIQKSGFSVHELLTLTSIVTKEARAGDQPKVAGVFMNRLDENMSLGSDVTVCYIYNEDRVELKQSQLDSENPYNTRKFAGLPPGPICQVIGDAMDAVLNYEESDDLFFFADEDGTVHYYKNNADFEQGIEDEGLLKDDDSEDQDN